MGCIDSKLDHLPAISLCRDRCRSLHHALRLGYALEDAHVAYLSSLRAFGCSLNQFVSTRAAPGPNREEVPMQPLHPVSSPGRTSSSSNSGSHVHFNYDSDDDDRRKLASTRSRLGHVEGYYNHSESSNPVFDRFASVCYARSQPPPYSTYIQPIYDTYPNQGITTNSGANPASPPPPPPPPSNSTWDFLNFFEAYGRDEQPLGSSSRRLKVLSSEVEVTTIKHETRIPTSAITTKPAEPESEKGENRDVIPAARSEKSVSVQAEKWKSAKSVRGGGGKDLDEVMKEVESLFEKASDSGFAFLRSLGHEKSRNHHQGFDIRQVSSKVLHTIVPFPCRTKPSLKGETAASSSDKDGPNEDATLVGSRNLCSTLEKLHIWEKKLYSEVKAKEKLRAIYSRKCKELKNMIENEKEGDADKIESNRTLIKNLSTQLKISLHVVEAVSHRISKSRDDELWPCLCQLLLGWLEMWKVMEDCHQRQHETIVEAKVRFATLMDGEREYSFERLEETMQVKLNLLNLELCFCKWAIEQKTCARALDCWLTKCLSSDPEGLLHHTSPPTETGVAPPVFAVSHHWANALDASRMMPVIGTMSKLVGTVDGVYTEGYARLHAKADAIEDMELDRKMKVLEKRDGRMRSEFRRAIRRGVIPIPITSLEAGSGVRVEGGSDVGPPLEDLLEAMTKYSSYCVETYEELCKLCGDGENNRNEKSPYLEQPVSLLFDKSWYLPSPTALDASPSSSPDPEPENQPHSSSDHTADAAPPAGHSIPSPPTRRHRRRKKFFTEINGGPSLSRHRRYWLFDPAKEKSTWKPSLRSRWVSPWTPLLRKRLRPTSCLLLEGRSSPTIL